MLASLGGPRWFAQEKQMPVELLEKIAQMLDPVTLLKFASTDSCVRRAAHQAAVTRLTKLA